MSKEICIYSKPIRPSICTVYSVNIETIDCVNPGSDKFSLIVYKIGEGLSGLYTYYPVWYGWNVSSVNPIKPINIQIQFFRGEQDLKIHISKYLEMLYPNCIIRLGD